MNKKKIIIAVVTLILVVSAAFFGINYTDEDIEKISEGIETVVDIINESTTEIPEAYIEDEQTLELQEVEDEAFELQGEVAYNGTSEIPTVEVGDYAGLTYYSQIDPRWKDLPYTSTGNSTQTIGSSGCGPTCASMVVSSIKGTILPTEMSDLFVQYGYRSANNGTYYSAFRFTADVFNIEYTEKYKLNDVCDLLNNNYMAIVSCKNGLFTTGGHFILIYGIDKDTLKIYDPYLYSGKFETSTRRGKVIVEGNTIYCNKEVFREYANYVEFFCFKNTNKTTIEGPTTTTSTYTRYVNVNTSLNVRSGAGTNYSIVGNKKNGELVTIYENISNWARIGNTQWVCSDYLSDSNSTIKNTIGSICKLKKAATLYSNSNLTGVKYNYKANTTIKILENINNMIDKVYVVATGRVAYINNSVYTNSNTTQIVNKNSKLKTKTKIYAYKTMKGTYYTYLPNTTISILEDYGNINKVKVKVTGRIGYIYE